MPRNVRNFWIEANIDGRTSKVATGPASKDGGFDLEILFRELGTISKYPIAIRGVAAARPADQAEGRSVPAHTDLDVYITLPPGTRITKNDDGTISAAIHSQR